MNHAGEQLELIVTLTSTVMATGALYQTSQSYTTNEILWGQRFEQCVFLRDDGWEVNEDLMERFVQCENMGEDSQEELDKKLAEHILIKQK